MSKIPLIWEGKEQIPSFLMIDISDYHVGEKVRVGDLFIPKGFEISTNGEFNLNTVVCHIKGRRLLDEEDEEEEAAAGATATETAPAKK